MSSNKLTQLSLLTAAALVLYVVELRLPGPIPIPGVKLGLANIITVAALYRFRFRETAMVVAARVTLGCFFAGSASAFLFSASGAVFCLCGMSFMKRFLVQEGPGGRKHIVLCSVLGALFHNTGQILAAVCIMRDPGILAFFPILTVTGVLAGLFTGLCADAVERRMPYV